MIDTLLKHRAKAEKSRVLERLALSRGNFAVVTLHRPSNVDDPKTLRDIMGALEEIGRDIPVVFPIHPRTRERLASFGFTTAAAQFG